MKFLLQFVVGAGAVVTNELLPLEIVAGVSARRLGLRSKTREPNAAVDANFSSAFDVAQIIASERNRCGENI